MEDLLIKNVRFGPTSDADTFDIVIKDKKIHAVGLDLSAFSEQCRIINAEGLTIIPGLVDVHVHLREPGFSYKERIETGTMAAAAGGFTTVCTMPNLKPAPDSLENLEKQLEIIRRDAAIEVIPFATITKLRIGDETVDYSALAPYVAGFSDDGSGVQSEEVMLRAMEQIAPTDKILAAHCEVNSLLNKGYIHDGIYAARHGHRGICSRSEWEEVERDILLAKKTGCRLHICHISTAESVDLIRKAKALGVRVTCETAPHYLAFCDEDLQEDGRFKMNPPLRAASDKAALIEGIIDGTIDAIATDHAPHSTEEKARGLEKSAMGVVGLETALAAVYTYLVKTGIISFQRMLELMAITPRKLFNIKGGLNIGDRADIALVDFNHSEIVDPTKFKSCGQSTPFAGLELTGKVKYTISQGRLYQF